MSGLSLEEWHKRFEFQARWTEEIRAHLFRAFEAKSDSRILEVGCGTGAILSSLAKTFPASYFGIDLDLKRLMYARKRQKNTGFAAASAFSLPFPTACFDGVFCHYFLLWARDPLKVIHEMARKTVEGGFVAALAEPDYRGRIDYPEVLVELGRLQRQALINQGADPDMGRKLAELFSSAGLINIQVGILGARWQISESTEDFDSEWAVLESDLAGLIPKSRLAEYKNADFTSRQLGERILYLPTFYAVGQVPSTGVD